RHLPQRRGALERRRWRSSRESPRRRRFTLSLLLARSASAGCRPHGVMVPRAVMMGAVLCRRQAGAAEAILEDVEMARPAATAPRDLLVRIEAASLNPIDRKRRAARPLLDPTGAVLGWS